MAGIRPVGQRAEYANLLALHLFHKRLHLRVGAALVYPVAQQYNIPVQHRLTLSQVVERLVLHLQRVVNALRHPTGAAGKAGINYLYLHDVCLLIAASLNKLPQLPG